MSFCKECIFWTFSYKSGIDRVMGECKEPIVFEKIEKDTTMATTSADGVLHTDQWFGCIHHRKTSMTVTKFSPKE